MPLYESTFIARPDISAQQVEDLAGQFQELVRGTGGEVPRAEYWGLRGLTYRIKKNRKGHYFFMHIDAQSDAIQEMERTMRINEDVIRYLTIRVDEFDPGPVPLTQSRGRGREGRGYGGGRHGDDRGDRGDRGDRRSGPDGERSARPRSADSAERENANAGDGDRKESRDGDDQ